LGDSQQIALVKCDAIIVFQAFITAATDHHYIVTGTKLLADHTATQYDRLLSVCLFICLSVCSSVRLSVMLCILTLRVGVRS